MKMKLSKYILSIKKGDKVVLLSTRSLSIITISLPAFQKLKSNNLEFLGQKEIYSLKKMAFLTDINERSEILKWREIAHNSPFNTANLTILTTTNCNAHCFYCYEKGTAKHTMNQITCDKVVKFIEGLKVKHVSICWFGGEPLLNTDAIQTINDSLSDKGITVENKMISNGFLIDTTTIFDSYKFKKIQITLDGLEDTYNSIKKYNIKKISPFKKVISNIESLLSKNVSVSIRLNFNDSNYNEILKTIKYLREKFGNSVNVYAHPIFGIDECASVSNKAILGIFKSLIENGYIKSVSDLLSKPRILPCGACKRNNFIINANGDIYKCEHCINKNDVGIVGNVVKNTVDEAEMEKWLDINLPHDKCKTCRILPICQGSCKYENNLNEDGVSCPYYKRLVKRLLKLYYTKAIEVN